MPSVLETGLSFVGILNGNGVKARSFIASVVPILEVMSACSFKRI